MQKSVVSVRDYGAVGDGFTDDRAAIQAALDSGADEIEIPFGNYATSGTLFVGSNTRITAAPCARIILKPSRRLKRGDFLLSNKNCDKCDVNITVEGGIWDGNNSAEETQKPDIFDTDGYSGTVLNFVGVTGLCLKNITVANSTTYYVRICRVENFEIENVDFVSDRFGKNQDGLHFGGAVRHGKVKNVRALSEGQTNDDMIALNADDSVERVENLDLVRDDIEDITFENIFAVNCYTIIRMLSVNAAIRNIRFKNIYAGYRNYAINGDGARYCKTPLFKDEDHPEGVGCIENIEIENFVCYPVMRPSENNSGSLVDPSYGIRLEVGCDNFVVNNFKKLKAPSDEGTHALFMRYVKGQEIITDGERRILRDKSDELVADGFSKLIINKMRG